MSAIDGAFEVAVEMKHGGKDWTVTELEKSLRSQLVEDYLRPDCRRHGLFVITNHRDKRWRHPESAELIGFQQVVDYMASVASGLTRNETGPIVVKVVGIDALRT